MVSFDIKAICLTKFQLIKLWFVFVYGSSLKWQKKYLLAFDKNNNNFDATKLFECEQQVIQSGKRNAVMRIISFLQTLQMFIHTLKMICQKIRYFRGCWFRHVDDAKTYSFYIRNGSQRAFLDIEVSRNKQTHYLVFNVFTEQETATFQITTADDTNKLHSMSHRFYRQVWKTIARSYDK